MGKRVLEGEREIPHRREMEGGCVPQNPEEKVWMAYPFHASVVSHKCQRSHMVCAEEAKNQKKQAKVAFSSSSSPSFFLLQFHLSSPSLLPWRNVVLTFHGRECKTCEVCHKHNQLILASCQFFPTANVSPVI
jgi:hypothetical protein